MLSPSVNARPDCNEFSDMPCAGMGSAVAEVAGLAVDTISRVVRSAGPAAVRPHLPLLVGSLLESLSTLEVSGFRQNSSLPQLLTL